MSICLTKDELQELTGKVRPSAQSRALNTMGIDYTTRPDGTIAVYRHTIEPNTKAKKQSAPDYDALNDVA